MARYIVTDIVRVNIIHSFAVPPRVKCEQYDGDYTKLIKAIVYNGDVLYNIPSAVRRIVVSGLKPDGNGFSYDCTWSGNTISFSLMRQMTAVNGDVPCNITMFDSENNQVSSAVFVLAVEKAALPSDVVVSSNDFQTFVDYVQAANLYWQYSKSYAVGNTGIRSGENTDNSQYYAHLARMFNGAPRKAATASAMTDVTKIYVYVGSESGYNNGHWYFYNDSAWEDGGVYNAQGQQTDTELSTPDIAADAKAVGDALAVVCKVFNNVSEMKADQKLVIGKNVRTNGYYSANDGGGACYKIIDSSGITTDEGLYVSLNNGLVAELMIENHTIYTSQFGCHSDKTTDDTSRFQHMLDLALANQYSKVVINNYMLITEPLYIYNHVNGFTLEGIAEIPSQTPTTLLPDQKCGIYFVPSDSSKTVVFKLGIPKTESDFLSRVTNKPGMVFKNFIIRNGIYNSSQGYPNSMTAFEIYNDDAKFCNLLILGADYGFKMPQSYTYNGITATNYGDNLLFSECALYSCKRIAFDLINNDNTVIEKCVVMADEISINDFEYAIKAFASREIAIRNVMMGASSAVASYSHDAWIYLSGANGSVDGVYVENVGENNSLFLISSHSNITISNIKIKFELKYVISLYNDCFVDLQNVHISQLSNSRSDIAIIDIGAYYDAPSFVKISNITAITVGDVKLPIIKQYVAHFGGFVFDGNIVRGKLYVDGNNTYRLLLNDCTITSKATIEKQTSKLLSIKINIGSFHPMLIAILRPYSGSYIPEVHVGLTSNNQNLIQIRDNETSALANIDDATGQYDLVFYTNM